MSKDADRIKRVHWAICGQGGKRYHAYITESDYERGSCLCGCTALPQERLIPELLAEGFDRNDEAVHEKMCPECRERLKLLDYMERMQK